VERQEIVVFHEDGEVNRVDDNVTQTTPFVRIKDLDDSLNNDVIGFLERPVIADHFIWSSSEPDAVLLGSNRLPHDWLKYSMFTEKLAGFRYFKADFKVRIQVNAQPFNAGMLMLVFIPLEETMTTTPSSMADFSGLTGYRHVVLDLAQDTACELTIPYSALVSHIDLMKAYGAIGRAKLYVYSPLTGSADVDGTIWITATNVEVALPTGLAISPPLPVSQGYAHAGGVSVKMKGRAAPVPAKDTKMTTKPPKKPKGAISSVADTVGSIAGALKDVPVIGGIADTVEWVSGAVSSVASFFGFSKPADTSVPTKQTLVVANNFANYDGDSKTKSLAFSWANETQIPTDVFQETDDEMCFSHILARPTYLTRFKMRDDSPQNTIIWKWPVDPRACLKVIHNDSTKTPYIKDAYLCANTYLSYLSNFFKFYRGTINYHFRVVKTVYHSGRIRVFVVPGATVDTDVSAIDFNKVHSSVFDLRETNQFDISVPYKWNAPWKALDGEFVSLVSGIANHTQNVPTAMIYVEVLNALKQPTTAANSIDFVVETSAGEDFQFACPAVSKAVSLVTSEEQLRADYPKIPTVFSGEAHSADTILDSVGGDDIIANKIAIGEVITGWRALLKRYSKWLVQVPVDDYFILRPYDSALLGSTKTPFDFYAAAEILYRFVSGGLRVGMKAKSVSGKGVVVTHEVEPYGSADVRADTSGAVLQAELLEPVVELGVPFYQPTPGILTNLGSPKESYASEEGTNYLEMPYNSGTIVRSSAESEVWRSTAEDFSFGYLVGPPQTLIGVKASAVKCTDNWKRQLDNAYIGLSNRAKTFPFHPADVGPEIRAWYPTEFRFVMPVGYDAELNSIKADVDALVDAATAAPTAQEKYDIITKGIRAPFMKMRNFFDTICVL
jgi:hypothetical protein